MTNNQEKTIKSLQSGFNFFMYTALNLPSLAFWGTRLKEINLDQCIAVISLNHRTKNPFKSMYFSVLIGGGELATGLLLRVHLPKAEEYSMLVVNMEAQFHKKAVGKIRFVCNQRNEIERFLSGLDKKGDSGQLLLTSKAMNEADDVVGEFKILWSVKRR
jgi:hypothetical protein